MPIAINDADKGRILAKSRKPTKKAGAIRPSKNTEVEYRLQMLRLVRLLKLQTGALSMMVSDGVQRSRVLERLDQEIARASDRFDAAANGIASSTFTRASEQNRERFERSVKKAIGIDTALILDDENIREQLDFSIQENVSLIKTIPQEHFNKVRRAIIDNYDGRKFPEGSLTNRLKKIGSISDRRAKFIARDQTAKFNGNITEARQTSAGIRQYIWRNLKDIRVTGYPGGPNKPSRLHGNHWIREGKIYSWNKPPSDGHPGQPIGCRCYPEPIINIEELVNNAL